LGIFELIVVNDEMRRALLSGKDERTVNAIAREAGARSLIENGISTVEEGLTSPQELLRVVGGLDRAALRGSRRPSAGSAGASGVARAGGFDVVGYQELLGRWLAPAHAATRGGA